MNRKLGVALVVLLAVCAVAIAQNVANYMEQGGARWVIGGSLDVASGGDLDIESGGAIKIAGTAVTSSAAELNYIDITAAGTAQASKAAVLGANKNLDTLVIADSGLKLGSGAGTAVTATAAELNQNDDACANVTFAAAAGGANVCEVTLTCKDAAGSTIARTQNLTVWLSDASSGAGLTGTAASGTVQAKSASGADLGTLTAKKALVVQTLATGVYTLEITDTGKTGYYVCAAIPGNGKTVVSTQLVTGDYGT